MHGGAKSTKEAEGRSAKVLAPFVSLLYGGRGGGGSNGSADCRVSGRWVRMKQSTFN